MKRVQLTNISNEGNKYRIYLGNGTAYIFKSERKAKAFLNATSKFLTQALYEIRDIYTAVWNKYQYCWGYFAHDKKSMNAELREHDRACALKMRNCEDLFNLVVIRTGSPNSNYHTFIHFKNILAYLKETLIILFNNNKNHTAELYQYDNLFKRLQAAEAELNQYGERKAQESFRVPLHIGTETEYIPETQLKVA